MVGFSGNIVAIKFHVDSLVPSAARGASRRAQPRGSASRCIGASRRVVRGNKTCSKLV